MDPNVTIQGAQQEQSQADAVQDGVNAAVEEENKFQRAIAAWRDIDLTALVPKLDTTASDIVAHQRDALIQRKDLAQKTKDFRKLDDTGKLAEVKALLKAYQTFIDLITNQSKTVQSGFLQVYSPLSEAPDPYPLLETSIDSLITAEEIVPRLTEENGRLQSQVATLTAQLEDTEKQLESERTTRQSLEISRDEKIKEVETSWSAVLSEKQDNWEAKERNLEEKVENQDRLLKELKASYEVSQRLGRSEDGDAELRHSGATAAELEIVSSELDRVNVRLAEVEGRNEQLRIQLAHSASQHPSHPVEDDPAYLRLRSENQSLRRKMENTKLDRDSQTRKIEGELRSLERELASIKQERDGLKDKLHKYSDYDDIKSELEVLKTIEFATIEDDDEADGTEHNGEKRSRDNLEQLLLSRNKKLTNDLTLLRVSHADLQRRLDSLTSDFNNTTADLEKSKSLNQTLESDLLSLQQEATNAFSQPGFSSAASVAGTYTSRFPSSARSTARGKGSSPTSSIISGWDPIPNSPSPSTEGVGGGSGILPMVTAQRDRFKKKIAELEGELQKQYATVSSLRNEIASLQKDNLSLYEKSRYLSSFSSASPAGRGSMAPNPNPSKIDMPGAAEDKYRTMYEGQLGLAPFERWRSRENARNMKRMSLPERTLLQVTKVVFSSRLGRNIFAVYLLALHMVVLMLLIPGHGAHHAQVMARSVTSTVDEGGKSG
ncbi:hypothetical protein P152DRAFT_398839 [Eremomyces bilateralis CBS 781.70]|uniref:Protein CASP n=1 Tax=Eremomyces bilateralis CBS 781.70 TaxID=1392243 RepID=A0A6G1G1E0_9PEZI|nr:uncharacterized protein P152DRAFT_398839 [Eremomyces bilateralis CBS 781.70]KAF1811740.1 hypothetical protein P152DRAFT_398839 [Eremomyces bilateralis CBS 781.70]